MSIRRGKNYLYGIHVEDRKFLTKDLPIENMPAPDTVYLSMAQHIGAPATPKVNVGDSVVIGDMVGESAGPISANIFSPICGEVIGIEDIINGLGQKSKYVIIKNNGKDDVKLFDKILDYEPKTLVERIRLAGIVGLGGAGFPTAVKLSPKSQLEYLIINGAECEPYLTCDYRLMLERTEDIYKGIKLVAKALNVDKIIMGIEGNKPEAVKAFEKYPDLDIVILKKQYPMGSEKHLIYCTTGRKVPCGKMPFDVGACVQNIKTMIACYEAIELNKPLTSTVVTVSGEGITNPKNVKVALGTPVKDVLAFCGGEKENTVKVIAGGPMMGKAMINLNQYVRKTDSGLLCLIDKEACTEQPSNCINCARCANNCPMRLMPMYIESFALAGDFKNAEKYGAMNCLECGSCAYNCPARRPLVQSISMAKAKIKEMKQNGR